MARPDAAPSASSTSPLAGWVGERDPEALQVREQLRLYRRTFAVTGLGSLTIAFVLAVSLWSRAPPDVIGPWLAAIVLTLAGGLFLRPRRGVRDSPAAAGRRLLGHRAVLLLHALAWAGLWPVMEAMPPGPTHDIVAFALVGVLTGVAITLSFEIVACTIFLLLASTPVVVHFAVHGSRLGILPFLALALFAALLTVSALRGWHGFRAHVQRLSDARAMADQSRLLEQLLQNTEQGVWFLDNDGLTVDMNPAMCRLLGRTREEVISRSVLDFFQGEDLAALERQRELRRHGQRTRYEIGIVRPDGSRVECLNHATSLFDAQGEMIGSVSMLTDLTVVKQASLALEASRTELRAVLDAFPGFIASIDQDFRYGYVNPATAQRLGRPAEQLPGMPVTEVLPLESVQRIRQTWWPRLARGEKVVEEISYPPVHGLPAIDVEVTRVAGPRQADGRQQFYAFGIDISDRKRAEMERNRHAEEMRRLLETFPGNIAAVSHEGRYVYINASLTRRLGYESPQDIIGRTLEDIIPDRAAARRAEFALLRQGQVVTEEVTTYLTPGGPAYTMQHTRIAGPADAQGRFTCYFFGIDVTALKEAEARMREAKEEAERANQAKSQFLSQMSHELRTPLNAILGFGQLLASDEQRPLGDRQQLQVQEILAGAQHLLQLINGLLDIGRIEAGRFSVQREPVPLDQVLQDALRLLVPVATAHRVQLPAPEVGPPGSDMPRVWADRTRLLQVVLNLLGNAIKYNRPGGAVRIDCAVEHPRAASPDASASADEALPGGPVVTLSIIDEGRGLTEEERARLFEPFERLSAEGSRIEGTGIGLALSRRLMQAMGGTIGVDSTPGSGSRFWVCLAQAPAMPESHPQPTSDHPDRPTVEPTETPDALRGPRASALGRTGSAQAAAEREGAGPQPDTPQGEADTAASSGTTLLYIEDNPVNTLVMRAMIERIPELKMVDCEDAETGLRLAAEHRPALILTDIQMPGMDGFELLQHLRADAALREIPVVAISADAMPQTRARGEDAGFDAFLTKPVEMAGLQATIERLLRR